MKITALSFYIVRLPFRFAFKHSLAERSCSDNIIAKVTLETKNGESYIGWGESVPRDYVTGETVNDALDRLTSIYAPRLINRQINNLQEAGTLLRNEFSTLGLKTKSVGASWCALELAVLDAVARASNISLAKFIDGSNNLYPDSKNITYGGVVPFCNRKSLQAILWFYRLYGFKTVKLKVGSDPNEDLVRIKIARSILGNETILRIDANAAWNLEQTLRFAEQAQRYNIASIEQPVPASDLHALAKISQTISQQVVADESLCTIDQAEFLAKERICTGFNIRLSKVGGWLAAAEIVDMARRHGIACHLGAQVGESGILSSAARAFASTHGPFENCEGSANLFLLKKDLVKENVTAGFGGQGKILSGAGLGISIISEQLKILTQRAVDVGQANPILADAAMG